MFTFPDRKSVIAVGGPPHSGKSVFLAELYRRSLANSRVANRVFLQRTCPDGEGMWSAESDQDLVKRLRQKGDFNQETMSFYINSLDGLRRNKDMVFADLGGFISMENVIITTHATDLIILSSKEERMAQWTRFAESLEKITQAIKTGDADQLFEYQRAGIMDVIPPTKRDRFSTEEQMREEVNRRFGVLQATLPDLVAGMPEHSLNVLAQLKSRLLTTEDRVAVDGFLAQDAPLPEHLESHVDTTSLPWQGEIVDLDRERGTQTYINTVEEITDGITKLNTERLAELQAEREARIPLA